MRSTATLLWMALAVLGTVGCERSPNLEVRTFGLAHISPGEAVDIVHPYIFDDREGAPGGISRATRTITVRETPDNLERIERVLAEHDRPRPGVVLHFRIIEADGAAPTDSAIADVVAQLEKLFRYEGYRQVGEAVVLANAHSEQTFRAGPEYVVRSRVLDIYTAGSTSTVQLDVELNIQLIGPALRTSVKAPIGRTVVLGTTRSGNGDGALILTVRSELQES